MQPLPADVEPESGWVHADRWIGWLYVVGGLIGLASAFVLLLEKIELLKDPTYVPSCNISPILNCGSIMRTDQAELFGFPNPVIGIAGFAVIVTVGMALLAGAKFRPWFWWGLQIGASAGVVFVHWLIFQSLYRIGALCPYCMVVWIVSIPMFWYTTLYNVRRYQLQRSGMVDGVVGFLSEYHAVVLTVWYLAVTGLIGKRFWDYWESLLT